jgi:hypothetical protein
MNSKKPKKAPTGDYAVGYARPEGDPIPLGFHGAQRSVVSPVISPVFVLARVPVSPSGPSKT